jgi:hypothetical protein
VGFPLAFLCAPPRSLRLCVIFFSLQDNAETQSYQRLAENGPSCSCPKKRVGFPRLPQPVSFPPAHSNSPHVLIDRIVLSMISSGVNFGSPFSPSKPSPARTPRAILRDNRAHLSAKNARPNHAFSISSRNSAHLIETIQYQSACFHAHAYSFSASLLICVICIKRTPGWVYPRSCRTSLIAFGAMGAPFLRRDLPYLRSKRRPEPVPTRSGGLHAFRLK